VVTANSYHDWWVYLCTDRKVHMPGGRRKAGPGIVFVRDDDWRTSYPYEGLEKAKRFFATELREAVDRKEEQIKAFFRSRNCPCGCTKYDK